MRWRCSARCAGDGLLSTRRSGSPTSALGSCTRLEGKGQVDGWAVSFPPDGTIAGNCGTLFNHGGNPLCGSLGVSNRLAPEWSPYACLHRRRETPVRPRPAIRHQSHLARHNARDCQPDRQLTHRLPARRPHPSRHSCHKQARPTTRPGKTPATTATRSRGRAGKSYRAHAQMERKGQSPAPAGTSFPSR